MELAYLLLGIVFYTMGIAYYAYAWYRILRKERNI